MNRRWAFWGIIIICILQFQGLGAEIVPQLISSKPILESLNPSEVQVVFDGQFRFIAGSSLTENNPPYKAFFSTSKDAGESWTAVEQYANAKFDLSVNPTIATSAGRSHIFKVVLSPKGDMSRGILELSKSADSGKSWSRWQPIVEVQGGVPDKPWLIEDQNGVLHLTYVELSTSGGAHKYAGTVHYLYSLDQGANWITPSLDFSNSYKSSPSQPSIGSFLLPTDTGIFLSWGSYNGGPIVVAKMISGHLTQLAVVAQSSGIEGLNRPVITSLVSSDNGRSIAVCWYDAHYRFGQIYFSLSQDGGASWSKPIQLTDRGGSPAFAMDKNQLHVLFALADEPVSYSSLDKLKSVHREYATVDFKTFTVNRRLAYKSVTLSSAGKKWFKSHGLLFGGYQALQLKNGNLEAYMTHLKEDGGWDLTRDLISLKP